MGDALWNPEEIRDILCRSATLVDRLREESQWSVKQDGTLVTRVDTANEDFLRKELAQPGTYFIGEESVRREGVEYVRSALSGNAWIVDPIDGTAPFAYKLPFWAISIGLLQNGVLADGAVYLPELKQIFITCGDKVLFSRDAGTETGSWEKLPHAAAVWTGGAMLGLGQQFAKTAVINVKNPVLASGCGVQSLTALMTGSITAYIGCMKLWDIAATLPMLSRLGCRLELFDGTPLVPDIKNGAFNLDPESENCWKMTDSFIAAAPEVFPDVRCLI